MAKVTGTKKTKKCGIFSGAALVVVVLRQFYAGGKISACCLVFDFISAASINN